MRYMRVLLALFVSANLLFAGCHGSRQSAAPVAEEYDRPGLKGVDPAVGQKIVKEARKWLGTKYVYGGKTRKGRAVRDFARGRKRRKSAVYDLRLRPRKRHRHCARAGSRLHDGTYGKAERGRLLARLRRTSRQTHRPFGI